MPLLTKEHYYVGGHEKACAAYGIAAAAQSRQDRLCRVAFEADECLICLEKPRNPTITLPCGHLFCSACVVLLREKGVTETCPLCRAPLPLGPEQLTELGWRIWGKLEKKAFVVRPESGPGEHVWTWPPLSASQQSEMDGAITMLQEAVDQVSSGPHVFTCVPRLASTASLQRHLLPVHKRATSQNSLSLVPRLQCLMHPLTHLHLLHNRATSKQLSTVVASTFGAKAW